MYKETKVCAKCKIEKPWSAFRIDVRMKDKLKSYCNECDNALHRAYSKTDKFKAAAYRRKALAAERKLLGW